MKQRLLNPQAARRLLTGLLLLFMALPVAWGDTWDGKIASSITNGEGTDDKPVLIKTAAELAYLAQQTNAGKPLTVGKTTIENNNGYQGKYFALGADIDLGGRDWTPIGNQDNKSFHGNFDGKGHCISGLTVNLTEGDNNYAGLFGIISNETIIQNLGVSIHKNGVRATSSYAGGIVGYLYNGGTIRNCYVNGPGAVEATGGIQTNAGGIAGVSKRGVISHCYTTVDVKAGGGSAENRAGGIVGQSYDNNSSLTYTYATGSVEATGTEAQAGGICGRFNTTFTNHLALNKEVKGDGKKIHRVAGFNFRDAASSKNYASPEIVVNGKPVDEEDANGLDGSDAINLSNYISVLTSAGSLWGDDGPWDSSDPAKLPKLRIVKSVNADGSPAAYGTWPNDNQPPLHAYDHLIAVEIVNEGGNLGDSWNSPIFIANRAELAYFAKQVNKYGEITLTKPEGFGDGTTINHNDNKGEGFSAYYFALSADIELQAREWTPIGNMDHPFCGHFDGKGHVVNGLKIKMDVKDGDESTWTLAGLFGYVVNGTLQNIGVELADEGIEVSAEQGHVFAGGIAGRIDAKSDGTTILRHCYVTGGKDAKIKITKAGETAYAGGITGWGFILGGSLTLTHCYATVDVESNATGDSYAYAGGIAGESDNASYCFATGNVKAKTYSGGICGNGTVSNSLALNPKIEGDGWKNRITAFSSTSNYASPQTKIEGNTTTSIDPNSLNGADTWLDTFKDDLLKAPGGKGWSKEKGWVWPESSSTQLPKLMVYNGDNGDKPYSDWPGQPDINATDYLSNQPDPDPKPDPEPEPDPVYPPPTPIYYTVTLPQVEGATTDPEAGIHEVESWNTFRFYLTLDPGYSDSQPIVTTSRGETLVPRQSDGAYLVKYVRSDVEISIDSIRPNLPPVANEAIDAPANRPRIWTEASTLCIGMPPMAPASTVVNVITADGRLLQSFNASPGLNRRQLPRGFYIIRISDLAWKVIIR